MQYLVAPITEYDFDNQLFETKIGTNEHEMPLHYTVWGKTEQESKERAVQLAELLSVFFADLK